MFNYVPYEKYSQQCMDTVLPWLRAKMRCNEGSVERAGAAQVHHSFFILPRASNDDDTIAYSC